MRIFPEMWASTLWPFSSSTRNMAFGSGSMTVPSRTIASSLGLGRTDLRSVLKWDFLWAARAQARRRAEGRDYRGGSAEPTPPESGRFAEARPLPHFRLKASHGTVDSGWDQEHTDTTQRRDFDASSDVDRTH